MTNKRVHDRISKLLKTKSEQLQVVNLRRSSKKKVEKNLKKYLTNRKQHDKLSKLSKAQRFKKTNKKFLKNLKKCLTNETTYDKLNKLFRKK